MVSGRWVSLRMGGWVSQNPGGANLSPPPPVSLSNPLIRAHTTISHTTIPAKMTVCRGREHGAEDASMACHERTGMEGA